MEEKKSCLNEFTDKEIKLFMYLISKEKGIPAGRVKDLEHLKKLIKGRPKNKRKLGKRESFLLGIDLSIEEKDKKYFKSKEVVDFIKNVPLEDSQSLKGYKAFGARKIIQKNMNFKFGKSSKNGSYIQLFFEKSEEKKAGQLAYLFTQLKIDTLFGSHKVEKAKSGNTHESMYVLIKKEEVEFYRRMLEKRGAFKHLPSSLQIVGYDEKRLLMFTEKLKNPGSHLGKLKKQREGKQTGNGRSYK